MSAMYLGQSRLYNPVEGDEELAQLLSGLESKLQVSIPSYGDKEQDCFYSV